MNGPSNIPDLNPIENMWNITKHRIEKRKAKNINEWKTFIDEEWKKIEKNCPNQFDSQHEKQMFLSYSVKRRTN